MLYVDELDKYSGEAEKAILNLFQKADKNQGYENDLLLVFLNGFYNQQIGSYLFDEGAGLESAPNQTQYEFFHVFRQSYLKESKNSLLNEISSINGWKNQYHIVTQLELLVYLKFWESDIVLKQLYNLCCRLLHGLSYDWHKEMKTAGRKHLIEDQIIKAGKNKAPAFYKFINSIYYRQIRNAAAHSQFYINDNTIGFTNHNPNEGHNLQGLSIDEWEIIFHRTILFYNHFIGTNQDYLKKYKDEAASKHFGKRVQITDTNDVRRYEWIRYMPNINRWVWYTNWQKVRGNF